MVAILVSTPALSMALPSTTIQTDKGAVQGLVSTDARSFEGIPFAAPPTGSLRWRAPAPVQAWAGVRPSSPRSACKQALVPPAGVADSQEDCLYLNVYTPTGAKPTSKLPVMVWIHGGAYITGAGSQYNGAQLAKNANAIVVTINYRLGIFGMLALPALSAEAPGGNHALQDQQAALRWVKRNIPAFGGDAGRVTIFGQSAGGASVCQQVVSPAAAGLFQRAIMQSGPCTLGTATLEAAQATGRAFALKAGCPEGPDQLACLRGKSTDEIFAAAPAVDFNDITSLQALTPYVDGVILPKHPVDLLKQGRFNRVPMLIGNTQDEGRLFIALAFDLQRGSPLTDAEYQAQVAKTAGNDLAAKLVTSDYSIKRFGSANLAFSAVVTDSLFACGTQYTARKLSSYTPTYAYEFQDRTVPQIAPDPFMAWGAYHAGELPYIFQSRIQTLPASPDPRDVGTPDQLKLSDQMVRYWARFAATGNPNGGQNANWPRFNTLTTSTQLFKLGKISTDSLGGIYGAHQCLLWDTASSLGLGL